VKKRIVAACDESKAVVIVDLATKKILKSVAIQDAQAIQPMRVMGKAADGSYMILWSVQGDMWNNRALYQVDEQGKAKKILKGQMEWCLYTNNNTRLFAQFSATNVCGGGIWYDVASGKKLDPSQYKFPGEGNGTCSVIDQCFMSLDRRSLFVPMHIDPYFWHSPYSSRTAIFDSNLTRREIELPGMAVAELPKESLCVSLAMTTEGSGRERPVIMFVSRATGRIVRKIFPEGYHPTPPYFDYFNVLPYALYIPRTETLLLADYQLGLGNVTLIRCGPVGKGAPPDVAGATATAAAAGRPPSEAIVGAELSFTPQFVRPAGAKKVLFMLKKGVQGMSIDAGTGKISFKPTDATLGKFDVEIVADVDGAKIGVLTWTIEIKP
jgi:hypothetical protein